MATAVNTTPAPLAPEVESPRPRARWRLWAAVIVGALPLIWILVIVCNWPIHRQALIDALQERSLRTVTIGNFSRTYFPPGCVAENISFLHKIHKEKAPLITVRKLVLVTSYWRILTLQERLSLVRVSDMHVTVPPGEPGKPNPVMPLTYSKSAASIKIDAIVADGAILDFLRKDGKEKYRLVIDKLRLDGVGNNEPITYYTVISNQMPPGKIRSRGVFGVWNPKDPGSTPVRGTFSFDNANLAAFHSISGTLNSSGQFNGKLGGMLVNGTADVPNFKVYETSHQRQLLVAYRASVDATNGDTTLQQVSARFDDTNANFRGEIAGSPDGSGKSVSIDMWTNSGRVQDVMRLFTSSPLSPITGTFTFSGHVTVPPGPEPFLRRMRLSGDFGVGHGAFTNKETERDLTRLSDSSHKRKARRSDLTTNVLSDLKGHGETRDGVADLTNVSFAFPGAKAWIHGTYGLIDYKIDLHGRLLTTGNPSDATTGFKSFMVKVIVPFLKHTHKAKIVPFKITGTYSNVNTSLDF